MSETPLSEFTLIQRYFNRPAPNAILGVGDDAAIVQVPETEALLVSADMLVEGQHFFPQTDPTALGHKTLAVNLSDMAAMAATPRWALLSIALPAVEPDWLTAFSEGFFALAEQYGVALVGGDTTRGPLTLSVHLLGTAPLAQVLRRDGAQVGDTVWVSGTLGDAALALRALKGQLSVDRSTLDVLQHRLERPEPRIALGLALRGIASAAIDLSDGLVADLSHLLSASHVAAELHPKAIPLSSAVSTLKGCPDFWQAILAGGDDYELCFTVAPEKIQHIHRIAASVDYPITPIGTVRPGTGVYLREADGRLVTPAHQGFDHFA